MIESLYLQKTAKEHNETHDFSWSIGHDKEKSLKGKPIRHEIFHFLFKLQSNSDIPEVSTSDITLLRLTVLKSIFSFQFASLAWDKPSNRNFIEEFWNIASYSRIDSIFSDLGLEEYFLYVTAIIICGYCILMLILYLLWKIDQNISYLVWKSEKILRTLIFEVCYIPMAFSLIIAIKYSLFYQDEHMKEYQNKKLNSSMINFLPLFIFTLVMLMIFNYIYEVLIYEHRHIFADSNLLAKSNSYTAKIKTIILDLILIYIGFYDPSNINYLRIFIFLLTTFTAIAHLYYAPYFNEFANFLDTGNAIFAAVTSVSLIIENIQSSQSTGLLLFIFLNPIFLWFLYIATKCRYSKLSMIDLHKECRDPYEFERNMRYMLIDKNSDRRTVLGIFNQIQKNHKLKSFRLIAIWESEYCLYMLNDSRLASIKLGSRYPWKSSNFEIEFLEFCLRAKLFNELYEHQDDIKFLIKLEKNESWAKLDKKFCITFNEIISLVYTNHYSIPKIYPTIKIMNDKFDILKDDYKKISKNVEANSMFSKSVGEKSEDHYSESPYMQHQSTNDYKISVFKRYNKINYNEDASGVLIISGSKDNIGTILYANLNAAKILKETTYSIIDSDINDYIPHPFSNNHKTSLENFIKFGNTSDIDHSSETILKRKSGFLIEIGFNLTCASLNKHPFFLLLFKEVNQNFSKCLLDESGLIAACSENVPFILNLEHKELINRSIFDFNAQIERKSSKSEIFLEDFRKIETRALRDEDSVRLFFRGKSFLCQYNIKKNCDKFLNILTFLKEENNEKDSSQNFESFLNFNSLKLDKNQDAKCEKVSFYDDKNRSTEINDEESFKKVEKSQKNKIKISTKDFKNPIDASLSWYLSKYSDKDTLWWKIYLEKIKKQFSIYRWMLFLCITILLATTGAILGYALSETNKATNINALTQTGLIIDTMIAISGHAVRMDISTYNNATVLTVTQGYAKINNFTNTLKLMTKDMLTELPSWNYCPWFSFYRNEEIPMWETTGKYKIVMKNLVDIIQTYEDVSTLFLHKISHNETYLNEINFLILNSMGIFAHKLDYILDTLTSCERYRDQQLTDSVTWLVIIAVIILGFCALMLFCIIFSICYTLRKFYNEISQKIKKSYGDLHNRLITKLNDAYGYDYEIMKEFPRSSPNSKWYENDQVRLISRVSIYFLISFAFFMIFYFYAYKNGEDYLKSRPDVIALLIKRQIFGRIISFWARIYAFQDTSISIYNKLAKNYFFENPVAEYWKIASYYKDWKLPLLTYNVQKFFSAELHEMMFEKLNVTDTFAQYGVSPCQDQQFYEMNYIFGIDRNMKIYSNILVKLDNIRNILNTINNQMLLMMTDYSTKLIQDNFKILTWLTVVYVVFSILIYFFFYLPNISKEIKRLEILKRFCKLI